MRKDHQFNRLTDEERRAFGYKKIEGKQYWFCKQCQSIVRYSSAIDQTTVNRLMANKMICLDPL